MKHLLLLAGLLLAAAPLAAHEAPKTEAAKHADAPKSFAAQPPEGTWARCAVSGEVFQVDKSTQFATYEGRTYAFCCDECKPDFLKDPAKFAEAKQR